jgi:hypothetical protein
VFWHGELRTFTTEFWRLGYQCFHITATFLFPLTPPELWHPGYEVRRGGVAVASAGAWAGTRANFRIGESMSSIEGGT